MTPRGMIELYYKDGTQRQVEQVSELNGYTEGLMKVTHVDSSLKEVVKLCEFFELDLSIFHSMEDIELSSHYIRTPEQLSFNVIIPNYSEHIQFEEEEFVFIVKNNIIFYFLSAKVQRVLAPYTKVEQIPSPKDEALHWQQFLYQIAIISDYYADLTELITSKIKGLYIEVLSRRQYKEADLDFITVLKLNNHLIKSSINRFQRILLLLEKCDLPAVIHEKLRLELEDLVVVSEHIQYNFDRLDGLKDNINIKIDLEQNKIFRTLTVITVCISIPTLIAGIYGMNFRHMPVLDEPYGYWLVMGGMLFVFVAALLFFKFKRWIR